MHRLLVIVLLVASCERCSETSRGPAPKAATTTPAASAPRRNWSRPPLTPSLAITWSAAETRNTPDSWDAAADAYARDRAKCVDDCLDAAYAVVLARKNAMGAAPLQPPQGGDVAALPQRARALMEALDDYVKIAPASDPDVIDMKFLAANVLSRWHQADAIEGLEELLREHRSAPAAEYAANMLIDALIRADRITDLKAWVEELLADAGFLAGKDELRKTLERVRQQMTAQ